MGHPLYQRTQRWLATLLALTVLTSAACAAATQTSGSSGSTAGPATKGAPPAASAPGGAGMLADEGRSSAGVPGGAPVTSPSTPSGNALERQGQAQPPVAPQPAPSSGTTEEPRPAQGRNQDFSRMIIYNTSITLTVKDVPASVDEVSALATRSGGYISGSSVRQEGARTFATVNIRVPAQGYAEVMAALRGIGLKVESEKGSAQDVTEEFADIDAQVRNLQVTEEQLRALMAKATTIDEILRVQTQISNVRGQIERLKGRQVFLQRNAELATINVSLQPEAAARAQTTPNGWDPLRIAEESWQESLKVIQALATVGIRVLVFSWWLIPVLAAAMALYFSRRHRAGPAAPAASPSSTAAN